MKDVIKIKLLLIFILLCASSVHAAPSLGGIDGDLVDWNGLVTIDDNESEVPRTYYTTRQDFDVEKIGVFIDDTNLYVGLQTGFNLVDDREVNWTYRGHTSYITGGDIALDFGSDGSYEFAFKYDVEDSSSHKATAELYYKDSSSSWSTVKDVNDNDKMLPLSMNTSSDKSPLGSADVVEYGFEVDSEGHEHHTLEAAIDYSLLTAQLGSLGDSYDVTVFWTMSCGNDSLSRSFTYTSGGIDPVPEPGTFLLFGFGLLGLSMYGRKKI